MAVLPFLLVSLITLALITFIPAITMTLPRWFGLL
jgi:TRAP-type C4-dicarboxylate transport system permease large subunit